MKVASVLFVLAGLGSAEQMPSAPGVAVTNSPPPPIVAVPDLPSAPGRIIVPAQPYSSYPPSPNAPRIVRPPQWRRDAQAYIAPADYPASARARGEQGWVAFTLQVGPDGRVRQCMVSGSSGSTALDSATCMIMRRRAHFTPAVDGQGMPAAWAASGEVEWRLPE